MTSIIKTLYVRIDFVFLTALKPLHFLPPQRHILMGLYYLLRGQNVGGDSFLWEEGGGVGGDVRLNFGLSRNLY